MSRTFPLRSHSWVKILPSLQLQTRMIWKLLEVKRGLIIFWSSMIPAWEVFQSVIVLVFAKRNYYRLSRGCRLQPCTFCCQETLNPLLPFEVESPTQGTSVENSSWKLLHWRTISTELGRKVYSSWGKVVWSWRVCAFGGCACCLLWVVISLKSCAVALCVVRERCLAACWRKRADRRPVTKITSQASSYTFILQ